MSRDGVRVTSEFRTTASTSGWCHKQGVSVLKLLDLFRLQLEFVVQHPTKATIDQPVGRIKQRLCEIFKEAAL